MPILAVSSLTGTRYFSRGIDAEGNVSNFVETEQLLIMEDDTQQESGGTVYGHVQIRGSIPLYWRQVVNVKYQPSLEVVQNPQTVYFCEKMLIAIITVVHSPLAPRHLRSSVMSTS